MLVPKCYMRKKYCIDSGAKEEATCVCSHQSSITLISYSSFYFHEDNSPLVVTATPQDMSSYSALGGSCQANCQSEDITNGRSGTLTDYNFKSSSYKKLSRFINHKFEDSHSTITKL